MTAHRVEFPAERVAPEGVTLRLREIDPATELVYLGAGEWALGSVQPSEDRKRRAEEIVAEQLALPEEQQSSGIILFFRLLAQGFRVIGLYGEADVQNGRVVQDFRERDWRFRNAGEETFRARLFESSDEHDLEERVIQILDYVHGEWNDLHAHTFLGRRTFAQAGSL